MSDESEGLARCRLRLPKLDFNVVHQADIQHQAGDALYRPHTHSEERTDLDEDLHMCSVRNTQMTKK